MKTIALFGVGLMGTPFARHLVEQGHTVRLYNRTRSKAEAVEGAQVFDTPAQAAENTEFVFSVLADDQTVLDTVTTEVLQKMKPDGVHLSCSTISVETTERLVRLASDAQREHLSCPFLGRPDFVEKKAHQFLLSGSSERKADVEKMLQPTCKAVLDFGPDPTAAVRIKLATNFMIASAIVSMGEAFSMLERAGLNPEDALNLWTSSLLDCPLYKAYGGKVLEKDYQTPLFPLKLGLKDTTLIHQEAVGQGSPHLLVEAVKTYFERAVNNGKGDLDWTGVTQEIRE